MGHPVRHCIDSAAAVWSCVDGSAGGRQPASAGDHRQATGHDQLPDCSARGGAVQQDSVGRDT